MKQIKSVIAIDGPAASGKGTLARMLAEHLHFEHLDSGILYRSFACAELALADNPGVLFDDEKLLSSDQRQNRNLSDLFCDYDFLHELSSVDSSEKWKNIFASWKEHPNSFLQNIPTANDVVSLVKNMPDNVLKSELVGMGASTLGKLPEVRAVITGIMREFASETSAPGTVIDGRDIGSVVFPDAVCKIFLTADLKVRAERRFAQLKEEMNKSCDCNNDTQVQTFESIYEAIKERDERDASRGISPMKCDSSYKVIDTSNIGIDEAFAIVLDVAEKALQKN